jgi:uncharacterized protein
MSERPESELSEAPSTESSSGPLPDYQGLVTFLLKPFVDEGSELTVTSEFTAARARVWVRVAFDGADRGRILGRAGRNIQAVRSVLEGIAEASGHTAYLDVYGGAAETPVKAAPKPKSLEDRPKPAKPVKKSDRDESPA